MNPTYDNDPANLTHSPDWYKLIHHLHACLLRLQPVVMFHPNIDIPAWLYLHVARPQIITVFSLCLLSPPPKHSPKTKTFDYRRLIIFFTCEDWLFSLLLLMRDYSFQNPKNTVDTWLPLRCAQHYFTKVHEGSDKQRSVGMISVEQGLLLDMPLGWCSSGGRLCRSCRTSGTVASPAPRTICSSSISSPGSVAPGVHTDLSAPSGN